MSKETILGTPNTPNQDVAIWTDESLTLTNATRAVHVTGEGCVITLPANPKIDQTHRIIATAGLVSLLGGGHTIAGAASVPNKSVLDLCFAKSGEWVPLGSVQGIDAKENARLLADSDQALSGLPIIDNVQTVAGDRVLANGQTDPVEIGLWIAAAGAWTRAADMADGSHAEGAYIFIAEGDDYADTGWLCDTDAPNDVVGTDPLSFVRFTFPLSSTAPVNVTKAAAAVGTSSSGARADHKHDVTTAIAVTVAAANAEGTSSSLARADHVHDHGALLGGDRHADATLLAAGFMSSLDKIILTNASGSYQLQTEITFTAGFNSEELTAYAKSSGARVVDMGLFPTALGTLNRVVRFKAALQSNVHSATWHTEVRLWDVTNGVLVTSTVLNNDALADQSVLTEFTSVALTVGAVAGNIRDDAPTLYSAEVRIAGAGNVPGDLAYFLGGRLEITYE